MNVLKEYLKGHPHLIGYDVVDHLNTKDSNKITLEVPNVIHDIKTQNEMTLRVADNSSNKIGPLRDVLDHINHNNIRLRDSKLGDKWIMEFTYDNIQFTSFDEKGNSLYSIAYTIKITTLI